MTESHSRYWIAVASAEHARRGLAGGFMQVNHGKASPLRRMTPGDGIVYYAPSEKMRVSDGLQSFVSIGRIADGDIYQGEMGGGFTPFRRNVAYWPAVEAPIRPLLAHLSITHDKTSWGSVFRFGLVEITASDFELIAKAMKSASMPSSQMLA